jgi:mannose-6-phosphate isomerase-like protein (cupin superfamily)
MQKINFIEKFTQFTDCWSPKIVGELNGQHVKLVKFKGPFTWHFHENELFLVIKGEFTMDFRDKRISLTEGEFLVVPKGIEHRPNAKKEVWVMLFEPASTLNTGNIDNEFTKKHLNNL